MATIGKTNRHARHLRGRQLAGLKFRRQATIGPYIADFLCIESMLIVEADGGQHTESADAFRMKFVAQRGYLVLRFWKNDILENVDGVLFTIASAAEGRRKPSPYPLPHAGEGN